MFFSVIITTYGNRTEKLKKAINSVLNQTFKDFEIIIIDDNGINLAVKNSNLKLIKNINYKEKIRYFTYDENKGANFARNFGIKKSQGEYIAFLDDDDEFLEKKLETIYKELSVREADLIYSDIIYVIGNKEYISHKKIYTNNLEIKKEILKRNYIGETSLVVLKKEKIKEVRMFDEELKSFQDWDAWIKIIFFNGNIIKINKPLIKCHIDKQEKTRISNNFFKRIEGCQYIHNKIRKEHLKYFSKEDRNEILFFQHREIASIYYENFKFNEYRKIINKIFNIKYFNFKDFIKYIFSYFNLKITKKGFEKRKK